MHPDGELALRAGEDARAAALRLGRAHEKFVSSHSLPSFVRPVVAGSWERCAATGASLDGRRLPPVRMDADELDDYRSRHPLAGALPVFRELLGERAIDDEHVFAIADAAGILLWVQGHEGTLNRAGLMNFTEGADWSETAAGTNALGTALEVSGPVQIFAGEHYNTVAHPWSCSAVPVRDPDSGIVLGVVDLTGGPSIASPYALALVRATVRAAEGVLATRRAADERARREYAGRLVADVRLTALGRDCALVQIDGRTVKLRPRHSEIVVILALAARGLTGPRLAVELSEADIHPVTLRAEMSRLRTLLGDGLLGSQPYALQRPVTSDFAAVLGLLAEGRVGEAVAAYPGPLLPDSEAPTIVDYRATLEQQLRAEVLASGDAMVLRRWVSAAWGANDAEAWRALARQLPGGSPQCAGADTRAGALDADDVTTITKICRPGARDDGRMQRSGNPAVSSV
jgi:hypothetical protein